MNIHQYNKYLIYPILSLSYPYPIGDGRDDFNFIFHYILTLGIPLSFFPSVIDARLSVSSLSSVGAAVFSANAAIIFQIWPISPFTKC